MTSAELDRFWKLAAKLKAGHPLTREEQQVFRQTGREWKQTYRMLDQKDRVLYVERLLKSAVKVGGKAKVKPVRQTLENILL